MTTLAVILAGLALAVALSERRGRRIERRWQADRERLEAYGEHLAARNGRPYADIVVAPADPEEHLP